MKILAVIPARAGSKGIPNKNIRLLNGKPLITYAINNAKQSELITDIVVTTDSEEIQIIAKQMGVAYKERSAQLSGDMVTLDAVIYDAAKDYDVDYIVTMQPTSPLLQTSTLDAAIRNCIENKLDTLISAINKPHLAWIQEDGRKIPAYTERKNRQYLPPYYLETGAFVISRAEIVTDSTRIGKQVDVYEIGENEAIDIDTFEDMKCAETILSTKQVAIYVNGNNKRGVGHVYRALELADEFYCKPDIYYDSNQTERSIFGTVTHNLIPVNGIGELLVTITEKQYDIFINDILTTSIDYMIAIRNALPNAKIVNFEDDGEGIYKADMVFNSLYSQKLLPNVYAGEKYYIASKLFMFYEPIVIQEQVKKVFISFGGADPQNYSDRLLNIIDNEAYEDTEFIIVLGRAKLNSEELLKYNSCKNISVYCDIKNMPELMSTCDVAVTSRGRTGYELAILGIPTISMAQNEREEKHGFVCNENGFSYIGLNPSDETIKATLNLYIRMSQEERKRHQDRLLSHDLRNGRKKVMNLIRD